MTQPLRVPASEGVHEASREEVETLKRWQTVKESRSTLPWCEKTIRQKLRNGELPGRKFGKSWLVDMKAIGIDFNEEFDYAAKE